MHSLESLPNRNSISQTFVSILLAIVTFSSLGTSLGIAYETERVVVVIIDGLRYSEGLGDPEHAQTPNMAALMQQGAIVDNFRNDGQTYTSRAIPAIWCGAWTDVIGFSDPYCNGASNNHSELPSVFEYYRMQLQRPETDCIYSLLELCPWKGSYHPYYGPDFWPLYHSEGSSDTDVWQETQQLIATYSPGFLMMYLADVDHEGHSGNWSNYLQSIATADQIVGQMWETLQADTAYAGRTTMLVTNDHGRHDYNFQGHGDDCEGCRRIQLLAIGPDTEAGLVSDISRTIPDITPTIGELLGFNTELATGTPMIELISGSSELSESIQLPQGFDLEAYPNPFNPTITLSYLVPEVMDVKLSMYDLAGRHIKTLANSSHSAGNYTYQWNGLDESGSSVDAGIYICRLSSNEAAQTTKIVYLK